VYITFHTDNMMQPSSSLPTNAEGCKTINPLKDYVHCAENTAYI